MFLPKILNYSTHYSLSTACCVCATSACHVKTGFKCEWCDQWSAVTHCVFTACCMSFGSWRRVFVWTHVLFIIYPVSESTALFQTLPRHIYFLFLSHTHMHIPSTHHSVLLVCVCRWKMKMWWGRINSRTEECARTVLPNTRKPRGLSGQCSYKQLMIVLGRSRLSFSKQFGVPRIKHLAACWCGNHSMKMSWKYIY